MKCLVCGQTIEEDELSCPFCGAMIEDHEEDSLYQSFSEYNASSFIVVLKRISTEEEIMITKFPTVVGRSSQCDIIVTGNPAIGRRHMEIDRVGEYVFIKDLNSKNHTYINDDRITDICLVGNMAKVRLADEEFIIEVTEK